MTPSLGSVLHREGHSGNKDKIEQGRVGFDNYGRIGMWGGHTHPLLRILEPQKRSWEWLPNSSTSAVEYPHNAMGSESTRQLRPWPQTSKWMRITHASRWRVLLPPNRKKIIKEETEPTLPFNVNMVTSDQSEHGVLNVGVDNAASSPPMQTVAEEIQKDGVNITGKQYIYPSIRKAPWCYVTKFMYIDIQSR